MLKIADFGLGKILEFGKHAKESVGTLTYASPEILAGNKYTFEVDIWSIGVIFYIISTGKMPFDPANEKKLRQSVASASFPIPAKIKG